MRFGTWPLRSSWRAVSTQISGRVGGTGDGHAASRRLRLVTVRQPRARWRWWPVGWTRRQAHGDVLQGWLSAATFTQQELAGVPGGWHRTIPVDLDRQRAPLMAPLWPSTPMPWETGEFRQSIMTECRCRSGDWLELQPDAREPVIHITHRSPNGVQAHGKADLVLDSDRAATVVHLRHQIVAFIEQQHREWDELYDPAHQLARSKLDALDRRLAQGEIDLPEYFDATTTVRQALAAPQETIGRDTTPTPRGITSRRREITPPL